jgi:hypothetical protein
MNLMLYRNLIINNDIFQYGKNSIYKYSKDMVIYTYNPTVRRFLNKNPILNDDPAIMILEWKDIIASDNYIIEKIESYKDRGLFIATNNNSIVVTNDINDVNRYIGNINISKSNKLIYGTALMVLHMALLRTKIKMPKMIIKYPFDIEYIK